MTVHDEREVGLWRHTNGAAYVETLLAFMPIFTLFLGLVQLALVHSAHIVVQHVAYRAGRCASVVLDDEERLYGNEPRNSLAGANLTAGQLAEGLGRSRGEGRTRVLGLSRRATVQMAAMIPLAPLAPLGNTSIHEALKVPPLQEAAQATIDATDVTFEAGPGHPVSSVAPEGAVTVRVSYRFRCAVPLAGLLVCVGRDKELIGRYRVSNHGAPYPYDS